jgi:hypothetical protein
MSRSINLNLAQLKRQLNRSTNVNVLKKPRRVSIPMRIKKIIRKPVKVVRSINSNNNSNNNSNISPVWNFLYAMLSLALLVFIIMLVYNLYISFQDGYYQQISDQQTDITIEDSMQKAPKGVIMNQEGAPISIEKGGNIAGNKYLALYGGEDFVRRSRNRFSPWRDSSPYASYPGKYGGGYHRNGDASGYYSQSDNGATKIYYGYTSSNSRGINNYIKNQNNYIRDINKRVRQINKGRMYTPTYSRDKSALRKIRGYERRLANQVHRERKNQPYLPDRNYHY